MNTDHILTTVEVCDDGQHEFSEGLQATIYFARKPQNEDSHAPPIFWMRFHTEPIHEWHREYFKPATVQPRDIEQSGNDYLYTYYDDNYDVEYREWSFEGIVLGGGVRPEDQIYSMQEALDLIGDLVFDEGTDQFARTLLQFRTPGVLGPIPLPQKEPDPLLVFLDSL